MVESCSRPGVTHVARLVADQTTVQTLSDALAEHLDEGIAIASSEAAEGRWALAIHFAEAPNETAVRALVGLMADAAAANAVTFERIEAKDWITASLQALPPVEAGRFLVHGRHDRRCRRGSRIGIEIEAALAFGTGHHGTTRGCLLALDQLLKRQTNKQPKMTPTLPLAGGGRRRRESFLPLKGGGSSRESKVLDIGTGSGVLAIAAARAMRQRVLASDIDRRAVLTARENVRVNKVAPLIDIVQASGLATHRLRMAGPFDLVLANILLGPLKQLARPMRPLLAPGARVVLSGLLAAQAAAALAAYRAQGLRLERRIVLEGWATLVLRTPNPLPHGERKKVSALPP